MEKQWYQSKTIIGAFVAILAAALGLVGGEVDQSQLTNLILKAGEIGGALFAMYGRVKADSPISFKKQ